MKRAQRAEAQAQQTRTLAESARGEAEKLIVYLLDDFYLELEPVGRLDIVAALAKRAVDYYAALPRGASHAPRPTATARSRWCATARRCATNRGSTRARRRCRRRSTSSASCARRAIDRRRRRSGSASGSSPKRAWRPARTGFPTKRSSSRSRAVDVLKPLMARRGAVDSAAASLWSRDDLSRLLQASHQREGGGGRTLAEAREAYRSIDGLKLDDVPAAVAYAEASSWQMSALQSLGRFGRSEAGRRRCAQGDADRCWRGVLATCRRCVPRA